LEGLSKYTTKSSVGSVLLYFNNCKHCEIFGILVTYLTHWKTMLEEIIDRNGAVGFVSVIL